MLYTVSLIPLVERGCYLRCVLSYVFLTRLIETPPDIGSFLQIMVINQVEAWNPRDGEFWGVLAHYEVLGISGMSRSYLLSGSISAAFRCQ